MAKKKRLHSTSEEDGEGPFKKIKTAAKASAEAEQVRKEVIEDYDNVPTHIERTCVQAPADHPLSLMGMPAEIRLKIYRLLLVDDIAIKPRLVWKKSRRQFDPRKCSDPTSHAIVRVCKLINQESIPVLYGENTFRLAVQQWCKVFLDRLGSMRSRICYIDMDVADYPKTHAKSIFHRLKGAKHLRRIRFQYGAYYGFQDIGDFCQMKFQQIAMDLCPLVTALGKARPIIHVTEPLNGLLQITPFEYCRTCQQGQPCLNSTSYRRSCAECALAQKWLEACFDAALVEVVEERTAYDILHAMLF